MNLEQKWQVMHAYRRGAEKDLLIPFKCPQRLDTPEGVQVVCDGVLRVIIVESFDDYEPGLECLECGVGFELDDDFFERAKNYVIQIGSFADR